jgi:hypothetical protein
MKKAGILLGGLLLSAGLFAQSGESDSTKRYCAKLMDGIVIMTEEGKQVSQEVTLSNGTVIKSDGTITKKDGSKIFLKDGECVDKDGNVVKGVAWNRKEDPGTTGR